MNREEFELLVEKALAELPPDFQMRLENVAIMVADWPSPQQLAAAGITDGRSLLGLYEGIPQPRRGRGYTMVLPDRITIFQKPIEAKCRYGGEATEEIRRVVHHEIAHHFGITDKRLNELERPSR